MMAIKQAKVQHVVAVPYPVQGRINPMLQLCQQLVPFGFTFTFVNTHHIHRRMQQANSDDGSAAFDVASGTHQADADFHDSEHAIVYQQLDRDYQANFNNDGKDMQIQAHDQWKPNYPGIRMVFVEGGCAPEEHARTSTKKQAFMAAQNMKEQVEQLISEIMKEQAVAFILTDIVLGWSDATARKFKLPWVSLWTASAATYAAAIHFTDLAAQGESVPIADPLLDRKVPTIEGIPGLPPMRLDELPNVWDDTGKLNYEILKYFHAAQKARFLLLNTFAELEGQVLEALSKRCSTLAVGPLLPSPYMNRDGPTCPDRKELDGPLCRPSLFREDRTCLNWLDKHARSSVLFIAFGSVSVRTEEQLEEVAHALEASGCPFLWVRKPDISASFTPGSGRPGAQCGGNGLIVPWAPQLDVLSHPAVGGFITHCGWNSVMESVAMGVPMLCWADTGERMSNQRFVVEFWKCGLDMVSDDRRYSQHIDEAVLVRRQEIERSIRCLMLEEAGATVRARSAHLRDFAITAFHDPLSPFNRFVQAMHEKSLDGPL